MPAISSSVAMVTLETLLILVLITAGVRTEENIANGRPAWQVSTLYGAIAERATDGNRDPDFNQGSCTHTDYAPDPWWYADLGYQATIGSVVVVNRIAANVGRLRDFNVGLMEEAPDGTISPTDYEICATYLGAPAGGEVVHMDCDQVSDRDRLID